ncbi:MAG: EamA family transporter [Deltaproteobacteria bacterium]|nr:EamA family transporter [Deltaproteobacteria bacterium]
MNRKIIVAIYGKLVLMAFFWGGTFIAGRMLARHAAPLSAAFFRFAIASVFLLAILRLEEGPLRFPQGRQILISVILGLTGAFAYNYFFLTGLREITAGRAALIVASNPVFIALFAWAILREPLRWFNAAGILLCLVGASVVITRGDLSMIVRGGLGRGEFAIMGCVASWVAYSLIGKTAMRTLSPLAAVAYSCIAGAALLFPAALGEGLAGEIASYGIADWASLAYLGIFGTVLGFTWYYQGIKALGASRAAAFINLVPLCAVVLGWFLLDESVDWSLLFGAVLVLTGVSLANKGRIR